MLNNSNVKPTPHTKKAASSPAAFYHSTNCFLFLTQHVYLIAFNLDNAAFHLKQLLAVVGVVLKIVLLYHHPFCHAACLHNVNTGGVDL